jgi:hypothetical protein
VWVFTSRTQTPGQRVTAANRNDITEMLGLVDAIPRVSGRRGRPKRRPKRLLADRAY